MCFYFILYIFFPICSGMKSLPNLKVLVPSCRAKNTHWHKKLCYKGLILRKLLLIRCLETVVWCLRIFQWQGKVGICSTPSLLCKIHFWKCLEMRCSTLRHASSCKIVCGLPKKKKNPIVFFPNLQNPTLEVYTAQYLETVLIMSAFFHYLC